MKRIAFVVVALFVVCSGLFASGQGGQGAGGKETIRVTTFFAGSDQWAPLWKELLQEYMQANPNVVINDESQPTAGTNDLFRTKVQTEVSAKAPPDLMLYYNGADADLPIASGLFADLTTYLQQDAAWAGNFIQGPLKQAGQRDGVQYCLPFIGYYQALFYNKALFDKYSLAEPTTWANLVASIDTFKKNGIVPVASTLASGSSPLLETVLLAQVGTAGQQPAKFFDSSWAGALTAIKDLYTKGAFPPDCLTMSEQDARILLVNEKAAMMAGGSWSVSTVKQLPGMKIIAMPAPPGGVGGEKTLMMGFGSGWYMSKAAAARSGETLKFLKWITSPAIVTRFITVGGVAAINCDAPAGASPLELSAVTMLGKVVETGPAFDSLVVREAWLKLTQDGLPHLAEGKMTAQQLLDAGKAVQASAAK